MPDQSHYWSEAADRYEEEFVDPYRPGSNAPLTEALAAIDGDRVAADLGCGIGTLLPTLAARFRHVHAVDFAPGMLRRARERCQGWTNVTFHERRLTDLGELAGQVDVAVAVNSLVQPTAAEIDAVLKEVRAALRPGGVFLGIVPAMDAVHYHTMLLLDRARERGMPEAQARANAAQLGEHHLYDFAFGGFEYLGLEQHFWQPFEVEYRLARAGFRDVRLGKVTLTWDQFAAGSDFAALEPPWDWFFRAGR
jgi:SAM-dependent methyltransferase